MAWLIGDGFDFYTALADATVSGSIWTAVSGSLTSTTRFSAGQAINLGPANAMTSVAFVNSATVYLNFAHMCTAVLSAGNTIGFNFILLDGGTKQVALVLLQDGSYALTNNAGAVITD
jgi:hypothetical protein